METCIFALFDTISIMAFLSSLKLAFDTNGIQKGADMWILHFMKKQAVTILDSRIALRFKSSCKRQRERTLTLYCKMVNNSLETYATDDIISETDHKIMRFTQPWHRAPIANAELLWARTIRCDRV